MKIKLAFITLTFLYVSIEAQQYGHWEIIDSTNLPRREHASVVMADGNVMVTGGLTRNNFGYSNSVEIFSVLSDTWYMIDSMHHARGNHELVLLNDESIFAIGGFEDITCEIYNPVSQSWSFTDSLNIPRDLYYTVTLLSDGKVLVTGGLYVDLINFELVYLNSCEIYDPTSGNWSVVDSLNIGRSRHSATLLSDGRVLIAGGYSAGVFLKSCEIFDPITEEWSFMDSLNIERAFHSSTLLTDGKVLVAGGEQDQLFLNSCEIYNPLSDSWELVGSMQAPRFLHTSVEIFDSLIMFVGGGISPAMWELYNSQTLSSEFIADLPVDKHESTVHLLPDGRVINIGGWMRAGMFFFPTEICLMYYPKLSLVVSTEEEIRNFSLEQNYPNPFNPKTIIEYSIPVTSFVELIIYDILGNEILSLVSEEKPSGKHSVNFNSKGLPSGIYLYRLTSKNFTETKKLILLK